MKNDSKLDKKTRMNNALSIVQGGPLFIDKSKLDPNYHYIFAGDQPGTIEHYKHLGYEFVTDNLHPGDHRASDAEGIGSGTKVKSKCGQTLYLMALHLDDYKILAEVIEDRNKSVANSLGHINGIAVKDQITGNVTVGNKTFG